jgi:hypothetical protein
MKKLIIAATLTLMATTANAEFQSFNPSYPGSYNANAYQQQQQIQLQLQQMQMQQQLNETDRLQQEHRQYEDSKMDAWMQNRLNR